MRVKRLKIKFIKSEPKINNFKLNLKSKKYIDDIQTVIAPTTPQITKTEEIKNSENTIENFSGFNIDDTIKDIKMKNAMKLINMSLNKNMIEPEDKDLELQKILALDDESFKIYQNEILEYDSSHEVTSNVEEDDTLTEAEKALKRIKGNGKDSSISNVDYNDSRDLASIGDKKITIENVYSKKAPNFENDFSEILSQKLSQEENNGTKNQFENKTSTFDNIQGLKKPIQIPSKQTTNTYKDLFSELDWTTGKK